ncbi:Hypothetical predicted protein [Paramuricea clavata]|uniref:Uncharacterized protein n=1 Tax=Paramuricea clavata TaxID=317549 RepID=A0A7D9JTB0_PARCT|nr:Hypothetical predicted protein [Paramuricea clavata]
MVGCIRKLHNVSFSPKIINCRIYPSYNPEAMKEDFKSVNWSSVYKICDVNQALKCFNGIVKSVFDSHAPHIVKKIRGKPCPWINLDIRKLMTTRDRMLRKFRKTKREEDWNLYKKLRNSCNNKMKHAKGEYQKDLLNENVASPEGSGKRLRIFFPTKNKPKNPSVCNDQNLRGIFSEYYAKAAPFLKEQAFPLIDSVWRRPDVIEHRTERVFMMKNISRVFVLNELKQLKRNKATGVDELPPEMLKDVREYIAEPLCYILNLPVKTLTVPLKWKIARLIPIHKSGSINQPKNFRPISVLPVLSKLLEKAVHWQYRNFLEE